MGVDADNFRCLARGNLAPFISTVSKTQYQLESSASCDTVSCLPDAICPPCYCLSPTREKTEGEEGGENERRRRLNEIFQMMEALSLVAAPAAASSSVVAGAAARSRKVNGGRQTGGGLFGVGRRHYSVKMRTFST
jgi:hypothetical protein